MPTIVEKSFRRLSDLVTEVVGSPYWFAASLLIILIWFPSGFFVGFSELWHLFINTFTTIFTFLMMSLLHSAQSKWEKQIEMLEQKQEKMLRLLEKKTTAIEKEIKLDIIHNQHATEGTAETKTEGAREKELEKKGSSQFTPEFAHLDASDKDQIEKLVEKVRKVHPQQKAITSLF